MREYRAAMEAIGQVFLEQHPISTVIPADQLLKWVAEHGNHTLKAALLIGRMNQQLSAIRHHLNRGAAGRYRVDYSDAGHNTFIVRGTRSSVSRHDKPLLALIEAGGVNDMPVIMPVAATANTLIEAINTVKAAGYRVSKPRKPKFFKRSKDHVRPTFVAEFADGTVTRMSTFTSLEKLDWVRGERLSVAAYQSRWRTHQRKQRPYLIDSVAPVPPAIISARFEQDGKILETRP